MAKPISFTKRDLEKKKLTDKLFIKTIQLWEESNRDWTTFP